MPSLLTVFLAGITACGNKTSQGPLLTGHVDVGDGIEISYAYILNNDALSMNRGKVEIDSLGNFAFDVELPDDFTSGEIELYVGDNVAGAYVERGKTSHVDIVCSPSAAPVLTFSGDNVDVNEFANVYTQAFDIMQYFSIDPAETKTNAEYRALLDTQYARVNEALSKISDDDTRKYFTHLSECKYDCAKARLIMDQAYSDQKKVTEYPEYMEILGRIDPNDEITGRSNLIYMWLSAQNPLENDWSNSDGAYQIQELVIIDSCITNPDNRRMAFNSVASQYFTYMKPSAESAGNFMTAFSERAKEYPELVAKYAKDADAIASLSAGKPVPVDPVLEAPDGSTVKLSKLYGKVLYIDVWATWCGPCCREIPYMEKLVERFKGNDKVSFVSISVDEDKEAWLNKINADKPEWPQYRLDSEASKEFMTGLGIKGIPRFIMIAPDGTFINPDAERPSDENIDTILNNAVK